MTVFVYGADGVLRADEVDLATIAQAVDTPFYCYASTVLTARFRAFAAAVRPLNALICYALKANGNLAVIRTLAREGAGADVVSGGELERALAAGIPPSRIVFSGVGKSPAELRLALRHNILQINVESVPELHGLSAVAADMGTTAAVALRVNPDVDAQTHKKIATGRRENKFGIDFVDIPETYALASRLPGVRPVGLAVHIGSQITHLSPFRQAFVAMADLVCALRSTGHAVERLDLGGGLGVSYRDEGVPAPEAYARCVAETVGGLGCHLAIEPGRAMVAEAGVLVARVLYVKAGIDRRFAIVDAAMNDLLRPSLYDAYHPILPVRQPDPVKAPEPYDVVGPVCESGDTFAVDRLLPPLRSGDLVAFLAAGAYGAVMASEYNARPLVPEVMVRGREFATVRRRPTLAERLAQEPMPAWLRD